MLKPKGKWILVSFDRIPIVVEKMRQLGAFQDHEGMSAEESISVSFVGGKFRYHIFVSKHVDDQVVTTITSRAILKELGFIE